MPKSIYICVLFLVIVMGCTRKSTSDSRKVFRYNESNGIANLDPAYTRDLETMWATNQLFDGLVELDSSLTVIPSIAKSWSVSEDGKKYSFVLNNNVFFHRDPCFGEDSTRKVTASDFVYSFTRILDPVTASPGKWIFANVDTTMNGGFVAESDSTLSIYLTQAFHPFLGMLTTQYANVVPEEAVRHYGTDFRAHPIGSGPFLFAFWYENEALVFHKNPFYWQFDEAGKRLPYLNAVQIDFVKDMNAEYQGLLKGTYDFMSGIHASFKDEILDVEGNLQAQFENKIRLQKTPFIKTDYLGILVDPTSEIASSSPLQNKLIRQAIAYAIDKKEMVSRLRNNSVYPADKGFVPPTLLNGTRDTSYYSYNPEMAKKLLAESGFPGGLGLSEITITATGDYTDLLEYTQHSLSKLGIKVKINIMQGNTFKEMSAKAQLEMFRKSWLADYADAENFLSVFLTRNFCPAGPNYMHYSNSEYDDLYQKASIESNDSARTEMYFEMNKMIMEEAIVIPLFYDQVSHFIRNEINGFQTNPLNMLDLKRVRK
jgi:oligopeptide transport system substrate-binding protein